MLDVWTIHPLTLNQNIERTSNEKTPLIQLNLIRVEVSLDQY